jgi:hypothetical protein
VQGVKPWFGSFFTSGAARRGVETTAQWICPTVKCFDLTAMA